jgi:hypothetical protein
MMDLMMCHILMQMMKKAHQLKIIAGDETAKELGDQPSEENKEKIMLELLKFMKKMKDDKIKLCIKKNS